ncbi:hypothetical protein GCM10011506_20580 [Marivirga lumbricoides]|uniref:HYR domain-containing protein n=1 Tax=Marivirga lumbricoides TaxID=1046115 RepID=A0ABQ1M684_9BACT|nr:hypothetical protein GCM10011506_20580 [Marivirga lumbricoides]
MLKYQASTVSIALKAFSLFLLLVLSSTYLAAQSCDCIDPPNCSPCEGSLSNLVLRFSGNSSLINTYSVRDGGGFLQSAFIRGDITINSRVFNQPFQGGFVAISLGLAFVPVGDEQIILISCNEIKLGKTFLNGTLEVISATSPTSGPICCAPEDTDQVPPSFENFPPDTILSLQSNCSIPYSWTVPTAVDDCGFATLQPPVPANNRNFTLGTETISYSAIDLSGNTFTQSFTVTVIDEIPPVITGTLNNIERFANNSCQAVVNWNAPTASDNCEQVNLNSTHNPGATFGLGTTTVTYTANDASGNNAQRSFTVTVSDNTAPQFTSFPENIKISANGDCETQVTWNIPQVVDNCSNAIEAIGTVAPGATFPLDTTIVSYTATDESGNEANKSFMVVVVDDSAPVFTSFPTDINISADNSCEAVANWDDPQAVDNCSGPVNPILQDGSPPSGSIFPIGSTTITYMAEDERGNELVQSFNVIVKDDSPPVFSGCPEDIILSAGNNCIAVANWIEPTAADNCELAQVSGNFGPNQEFSIGTTEVIYTAVDAKGNTSICSFNIIVNNNFTMEVNQSCPSNVTLELFDPVGVSYDWEAPEATLQCASIELKSNYEPGDLFPLGENQVRYFYTLNNEEVEFCSFIVNVKLAEVAFTINQIVSPNGDNNNDTWVIENIEKFPQNSVTVVDRWGGEVYSANSYNNEEIVWDGSNKNGDLVPTGTYFYVISVNFESEIVEKRGFIELIR